MFEIKERDGLARIGEFETEHGTVETPAIMPVVNPNKMTVSPRRMKETFGAQILITNSYVIYQTEELRKKALEEGLHSLLDFDFPIMTDSGTFQAHVYGDVDVDHQEIIGFQKRMDSDVSTILDEFTEPDDEREVAEEKVRKTMERARYAVEEYEDEKGHIALPVQGSVFPELRERAGKEMKRFEGVYPIGGVVPLLENYRFSDLVNIILSSKKGLGAKGPVHLFGAGHPMVYPLAVLLGVDLFDSSSYIKYARRGDLMYPDGTKKLREIEHFGCHCPTCMEHEPAELREMEEGERTELMAEHNLWVCFNEIEKVKQAVKEESVWEMAERRCRSHPHLLSGIKEVYDHWRYLERFEPRSRHGAVLYTGRGTLKRPLIRRFKEWVMEEYEPLFEAPTILFDAEEVNKPYNRSLRDELSRLEEAGANILFSTPLGPVPLELDETYPVPQSVFLDERKGKERKKELERYKEMKDLSEMVRYDDLDTLDEFSGNAGMCLDDMRVKTIADYQFGKGAGELFVQGKTEYVKNRKGRIKNVMLDGKHVLSLRHYDGLFTLKMAGAMILKEELEPPRMRVTVTEDSAEFNSQGKNVFCKFVIDADENIRPGDEVLVVDEYDNLVAAGRAFLNSQEMSDLKRGIAVRIREGRDDWSKKD